MVVVGAMTGASVVLGIAAHSRGDSSWTITGFSVAALLAVLGWRQLRTEVRVDEKGVQIVNLLKTRWLPWSEVVDFSWAEYPVYRSRTGWWLTVRLRDGQVLRADAFTHPRAPGEDSLIAVAARRLNARRQAVGGSADGLSGPGASRWVP